MKLAIDAMSGDLGSSIVVEACQSFLNKNKTDELYVVGKIEELEALKEYVVQEPSDIREWVQKIVPTYTFHKEE